MDAYAQIAGTDGVPGKQIPGAVRERFVTGFSPGGTAKNVEEAAASNFARRAAGEVGREASVAERTLVKLEVSAEASANRLKSAVTGAEGEIAQAKSAVASLDQSAIPQVRLNQAQGALGEDKVRARLLDSKSLDLVEEQVRIRTPGEGSYRRIDFLVRSKRTGRLSIIEVKTGGATRDAAQLAKDALIANPEAPTTFFGQRARAARFADGTPTGPIRTFEVNADNVRSPR
jgi:hypothetical protein